MKRWYVDTCVLVAFYTKKKNEIANKKLSQKIFQDASEAIDLELVTSHWALTELTKALSKNQKMDIKEVQIIVSDLIRKGRIGGAKLHLIDLSPKDDYDFSEMCSDLQDGILSYSVGFQDVLHTIIMKNHGIKTILTFDSGFEDIDGLEVVDIDEQTFK